MTDTKKLEDKIEKSGKKKKYLADVLGLSVQGFRNCCVNKAEFKASHISILCEELNITSADEKEAIFFKKDVASNATKEAV